MKRIGKLHIDRLMVFGLILIVSVAAFEIYNFDSTRYSLSTFFGDASFFGISWSTILAIAFCGVDFAGIAQLFTPQRGKSEPTFIWFLFGGWLLASMVNTLLTWWAVLNLMSENGVSGNNIIAAVQVLRFVPATIAIMVWLVRMLLIGVTAFSGDQLLQAPGPKAAAFQRQVQKQPYRKPQSRRELRQAQSQEHQERTSTAVGITLDDLMRGK